MKRYILLKLTNGELVKLNVNDVIVICVARENENGELFIERHIKMPELNKIVEYPQAKETNK